ncbi:MAG TPA: hypothetical protein VEQ63_09295 [Bryobacteraceae bacterium]|nr:hypothetical protein [Bryobacteraceae bacterium]
MQKLKLVSNRAKTQYSEEDAAGLLNITVEQLRRLIKDHILVGQEQPDHSYTATATFRPSDVLLLRLLARQSEAKAIRQAAS